MRSLLQTRLYQRYLETKDIDLEDVIAWFFKKYLAEEFGALNFSFTPSTRGTSYLEKVRHLFVEMESVVNQFRLFVENGELDPDLLAITSDPVMYKQVPSLLDGKYVYPTDGDEIAGILHVLLRSLFTTGAVSYFHLSEAGRAEVDAMEARGWVTRRSSLLTEAEGKYFNLLLNKVDFSNGPELRNKYLHGSQVNAEGEDAHFQTYITALKLTIALIIKVNDDFCLSASERPESEDGSDEPHDEPGDEDED